MLLADDLKLAFIHIPKTGGSSVTAALIPYITPKRRKPAIPVGDKHWQSRFHITRNMHSRYRESSTKIPDGYKVFSVVRNPWERFASIYWNFGKGKSIEDFCITLLKKGEKSRWTQLPYLTDRRGKMAVDTIVRFENIETEFKSLTGIDLPHHNKKIHPPYESLYDPFFIRTVQHMLREDIEYFGYKRPYIQRMQTMDKDISILVPSRGRPGMFSEFIESIRSTATSQERIEVLVYVDMNDPSLEKYIVQKSEMVRVLVGVPQPIGESWNALAVESSGSILMMGNDDQVYITKGWDDVVRDTASKYNDDIYCLWFDDTINGPKHCAFPIISRKWYETVGYFVPEVFGHLYVDTWIFDIAKRINRFEYIPSVVCEHRHCTADETAKTARGRKRNDPKIYESTEDDRKRDAEKLKVVMECSDTLSFHTS